MTRIELLQVLLGQAKLNGFEFRRWYVRTLGLSWVDGRTAISTLAEGRRYYTLLFAHEFAQSFWKAGEKITFLVPNTTFQRKMPNGTVGTVIRKGYTRRSGRQDAWRYHLRELALAEDPLRYMRRYVPLLHDDLQSGLEMELEEAG